MVKSWPSKYCLKANELAIQVLGGSGYIREYPVEQYYRDNRLNPIHEGTEAIHGLDLLGRKVLLNKGAGLTLFTETVLATIEQAKNLEQAEPSTSPIEKALVELNEVTKILTAELVTKPDLTLANATIYLDLFGRVIASWIWLKQALKAAEGLNKKSLHDSDANFYRGKLQAARYYIQWELPELYPQAELLKAFDEIPYQMQDNWF